VHAKVVCMGGTVLLCAGSTVKGHLGLEANLNGVHLAGDGARLRNDAAQCCAGALC
jgi:hypothetical protein